jgi:phenylacetate-coenzyme A ligase PaaK-like adenylate-forming protein
MANLITIAFMKHISLDDYFNIEQYSLDKTAKGGILLDLLNEVHTHHYEHSSEYKRITEKLFDDRKTISTINELPFIPISLFKQRTLKSIPDDQVYKVITSSGTTGSIPSRVYLDSAMAQVQTKALTRIVSHVIGNERLPMLIVDSKSVLKDRTSFSARGAGIIGLSVFGKKHQYLLDENYEIDYGGFRDFISAYNGQKILIFGFTFMVWQYLYQASFDFKIDLSNAILIHSGGWKKMEEMAVDNSVFKQKLKERFGLQNIYNFYGMAEQVGSIFLENADGYLHCANYSDIIIRNPVDFSVQENGREGLIQVISILPKSYPGHSILTEDIGICMGEDNSSNGWKGKYFKILGRAKKAEIRGCSDTFSN